MITSLAKVFRISDLKDNTVYNILLLKFYKRNKLRCKMFISKQAFPMQKEN